MKGFKEYLQYLLHKYRLSQRQLAKRSGVNFVTINRLLNGVYITTTHSTVEALAKGLGANKGELYGLHRCAGTVDEKLLSALSQILSHWREFGPEYGFDELIETTLGPIYDEGIPIETEILKDNCSWCHHNVIHWHPEDLERMYSATV